MAHSPYILILVGTDGSGKSTLGLRLAEALPIETTYIYYGLRHFSLPGLELVFSRWGDSALLSRYFLLPMEYLIRRCRLPAGQVAILDRIPGWPFAGDSWLLKTIFRAVLPKADMLVLCSGDPETIARRKNARSLEDCALDIAKWGRVLQTYPARNRLVVDSTANSVDDSFRYIARALTEDREYVKRYCPAARHRANN